MLKGIKITNSQLHSSQLILCLITSEPVIIPIDIIVLTGFISTYVYLSTFEKNIKYFCLGCRMWPFDSISESLKCDSHSCSCMLGALLLDIEVLFYVDMDLSIHLYQHRLIDNMGEVSI